MATPAERKREQRRREKEDNPATADAIKRELFKTFVDCVKVYCDIAEDKRDVSIRVEQVVMIVSKKFKESDRPRVMTYLGLRDTSPSWIPPERSGGSVPLLGALAKRR